MIRFFILLLLSFLFMQNAIAADSAETLYAKAYSSLYKGNNRNAIAIYTRAIGVYPDCAFLYAGLGDAYRKEGDFDKALENYTLAQQKKYAIDNYKVDFYSTKVEKDYIAINSALNYLIEAAKNNENAVIYSNINRILNERYYSLKLIPESYQNASDEELTKANKMKESGQAEAALKKFLEILAKNPNNFQAANNAGVTLVELKDYTLAQKYFEQALQLNQSSAIIYNNMGILNYYKQKYQDMNNNFSQALKINSAYLPAINNTAVTKILSSINYYKTQNIDSLLEIMKNDFDNYYAAKTLSQIYILKGDYKGANDILGPFNSSYNFKLYTLKAKAALLASDNAKALEYINKAITLYSDNPVDYEIRGRIYTSMKKYTEANSDFKTALQKNSQNPNVYYYMARANFKSGDSQAANNNMKAFLSAKKGNPQTSFLKTLYE